VIATRHPNNLLLPRQRMSWRACLRQARWEFVQGKLLMGTGHHVVAVIFEGGALRIPA